MADAFKKWVREVINPQAEKNGNSVALDDFSTDGMTEYCYPKRFAVNGDPYSWDVVSNHTKGRHLCTHYELYFQGKVFGGNSAKVATGNLTLAKVKKGLRMIYNYYYGGGEVQT